MQDIPSRMDTRLATLYNLAVIEIEKVARHQHPLRPPTYLRRLTKLALSLRTSSTPPLLRCQTYMHISENQFAGFHSKSRG